MANQLAASLDDLRRTNALLNGALRELHALLTEAALLLVLKSGRLGSVEVRDDVHAELDAREDRGLGTLHRAKTVINADCSTRGHLG